MPSQHYRSYETPVMPQIMEAIARLEACADDAGCDAGLIVVDKQAVQALTALRDVWRKQAE